MPDATEPKATPARHPIAGEAVLNPALVAEHGLDAVRIARLQRLHAEMHDLKALFEHAPPSLLPAMREKVQRIEYDMQEAWGWARDASFHTHWREVAGCRCPGEVNRMMAGRGLRYVAEDCPVHPLTEVVPDVTLMPHRRAR